jgi:hypothetical protein
MGQPLVYTLINKIIFNVLEQLPDFKRNKKVLPTGFWQEGMSRFTPVFM